MDKNWLPAVGNEPTLRRYECGDCYEVWFSPRGKVFKVNAGKYIVNTQISLLTGEKNEINK